MRPFPSSLLPALLLLASWGCDAASPRPDAAMAGVPATRGDTLPGRELAAIFGCGACHPGAPAPTAARSAAPSLSGLSTRWSPRDLAAYLADPVPLREGVIARMPDFRLDGAEATAVAMHLLEGDRTRRTRSALERMGREHAGATADRGAAIVDALNCAGCHSGLASEAWAPGPPVTGIRERVRPGWARDYLAAPRAIRPFGYHPGSGSRMPDFDLSAAETDSLVRWLSEGGTPERAESTAPDRLSPFQAAKAEALLRERLACLGCHALGEEGGRIGPPLDDAGARLRPDYLRRVVTAPASAVPGTIMPAPLEDSATIGLVIRYLRVRGTDRERGTDRQGTFDPRDLSLVDHAPRRPRLAAARDAAALYATYCAACHGAGGRGDGFNARYLPTRATAHADSAHMSTRPDDTLFDGIHGGGHILGRSHRMPAFGAALTSSEIRALVAHLRELCACDQPGWAGP